MRDLIGRANLLFGAILMLVGPYVVAFEPQNRGLGVAFFLFGLWILGQEAYKRRREKVGADG